MHERAVKTATARYFFTGGTALGGLFSASGFLDLIVGESAGFPAVSDPEFAAINMPPGFDLPHRQVIAVWPCCRLA
jgi:hypothetical protein